MVKQVHNCTVHAETNFSREKTRQIDKSLYSIGFQDSKSPEGIKEFIFTAQYVALSFLIIDKNFLITFFYFLFCKSDLFSCDLLHCTALSYRYTYTVLQLVKALSKVNKGDFKLHYQGDVLSSFLLTLKIYFHICYIFGR